MNQETRDRAEPRAETEEIELEEEREEHVGRWIEVPVERQPDPEPGRYDVPDERKKLCKECGPTVGEKPLSEFGTNKNSTDGYARTCIECTSAIRREANVKKAEKRARGAEPTKAGESPAGSGKASSAPPATAEPKILEHDEGDPETKECSWCGPIEGPKPLDAFAESQRSPDGRVNVCYDCRSSQARRAGLASPFAASKQLAGRQPQPDPQPEPFVPTTVTTYPKTERAPEPEKKPPKVREDAPERFCSNGTNCAAFEQLDGPTKLNKRNKSGVCGACETRSRNGMVRGRRND